MPKARSYKNEPFTSFEKQSFSVMKDDFVHEKLLTVKANIQSDKGGVNLKQTLNQKGEALTSSGQTKLWFYFKKNYSLYTKIETNAITLAYDHGIIKRNNQNFNCYGSIQTNRKIDDNILRVGVETFSVDGTWSANNMLQFNQKDNSLYFFSKGYRNHNNWFFNNYQTVDLTGKAFKQSAFLVSYKKPAEVTKQFSARFELPGFKNNQELLRSLLQQSKLTLNYVRSQKGNFAHGVELSTKVGQISQLKNNLLSKLSTAVQIKVPEQNSTFKLKLSGNFTAALSLKHSLGSFGTYTWGAELSDLGAKNNIRFGVQVDLNL